MKAISQIDNSKTITDKVHMIRSCSVLFFVILGFMLHDIIHIETCIVALLGASILLIFEKPTISDEKESLFDKLKEKVKEKFEDFFSKFRKSKEIVHTEIIDSSINSTEYDVNSCKPMSVTQIFRVTEPDTVQNTAFDE